MSCARPGTSRRSGIAAERLPKHDVEQVVRLLQPRHASGVEAALPQHDEQHLHVAPPRQVVAQQAVEGEAAAQRVRQACSAVGHRFRDVLEVVGGEPEGLVAVGDVGGLDGEGEGLDRAGAEVKLHVRDEVLDDLAGLLDGQLIPAHDHARRDRRHAREGEEEGLGNVVGDVRLFDVGGRLVEVGEAEHERVVRRARDPAAPLRRGAVGAVDDVEGEDGRRRSNHGSRSRRPRRRGRCHISQRRCSRAAGC
jgi:hypothetical protein